jgi:hypothetical protein
MTLQRSLTLGTVVLLLTMCMAGCIKPDPNMESPIGTYPKITVDFVNNVTKIYVKALIDTRYTNMTIRAYHGNVTFSRIAENNTYILHLTVEQKEFTLNATATDTKGTKIKVYAFEANITVRPSAEPNVLLRISEYKKDATPTVYKIKESDLPWSTLGDRIE